jgi:predicted transcriptional regulator
MLVVTARRVLGLEAEMPCRLAYNSRNIVAHNVKRYTNPVTLAELQPQVRQEH